MSRSQPQIREILRIAPDGMTVAMVSAKLDKSPGNVLKAIRAMPDVYIDRWAHAKGSQHKYAAVYALADVPEDAPKPE